MCTSAVMPLLLALASMLNQAEPVRSRTLPTGFVARVGSGIHDSGWPLEIVCETDGAVMVFVPAGELHAGLNAQQTRALASLSQTCSPIEPPWNPDEGNKDLLAVWDIDGPLQKRLAELADRLPADQFFVECMIERLKAEGTPIPQDELAKWRDAGASPLAFCGLPSVRKRTPELNLIIILFQEMRAEFLAFDPIKEQLESMTGCYRTASDRFVSAFYIDVCEVTNERYRRFAESVQYLDRVPVARGKHLFWNSETDRYELWKDPKRSHDRQPVTCVTPDDARAFAKWAGKSIPNIWQWERAATGDGDQLFPWGDDYQPGICRGGPRVRGPLLPNFTKSVRRNWYANAFRLLSTASETRKVIDGLFPAHVGSHRRDRSPFGCLDMAGNVCEWVWTKYGHMPAGGSTLSDTVVGVVPACKPDIIAKRSVFVGFRTILVVEF